MRKSTQAIVCTRMSSAAEYTARQLQPLSGQMRFNPRIAEQPSSIREDTAGQPLLANSQAHSSPPIRLPASAFNLVTMSPNPQQPNHNASVEVAKDPQQWHEYSTPDTGATAQT